MQCKFCVKECTGTCDERIGWDNRHLLLLAKQKISGMNVAAHSGKDRNVARTHVCDEVVESLLLLTELNDNGKDVVIQPYSRHLSRLLDIVAVHNVSANMHQIK